MLIINLSFVLIYLNYWASTQRKTTLLTIYLSLAARGCLKVSIVNSLMTAELRSRTLFVPRRILLKSKQSFRHIPDSSLRASSSLPHKAWSMNDDNSLIRTSSPPSCTLAFCIKIVVLRITLPWPGQQSYDHHEILDLIDLIIIMSMIIF